MKTSNKLKEIAAISSILFFIILAYASKDKENSKKDSEKKNCAVISAPSRSGSFPVSICRKDYSSDKEWEAKIKKIKDAKSLDQLGNTYAVYVDYE